ncbi:unnamed protein product [Peniophora sp. CBMAI 1063]|nr:unnamed protein product [Peniophora sp. CBMAI 1063]
MPTVTTDFKHVKRALLEYYALLQSKRLTNAVLASLPLPSTLDPSRPVPLPGRLKTLLVLISDTISSLALLSFFVLPLFIHAPAYVMGRLGARLVEDEEETPEHPVHDAARRVRREYARAILLAKRAHWEDWLDRVGEKDVWTANRYAASTGSDGGSSRIPTLVRKGVEGQAEVKLASNEEKSELLARAFFPPPPEDSGVPENHEYPPPVEGMAPTTEDLVRRHIAALSPYKAPGPDGIQNVVLMQCVDLVAPRLLWIYRAILELKTYYDAWHEFLTVVLRKPGKPSYTVAKAYRPIALLCTMAKVLTAIIAEQVTYLAHHHSLLPKTQFGGRPGHTTTDAMHYLVDNVTSAWAEGQVVSILFLDIAGAFPNAVPDVLIHDMRERRIPVEITDFVNRLLLKFDDYESKWFDVTNGIPQGDPLSLILYLFYGAGLLEVVNQLDGEDSSGFVDDTNLFAIGRDFFETTEKLVRMFERLDGAHAWAKSHHLEFEITKFCLMHLTRKKEKDGRGQLVLINGPPITLAGHTLYPVDLHKYLGVQFDRELRFKAQARDAAERGKSYTHQVRRLTKNNYGLAPSMNRRIYEAVVTKKMLYAVDVWCLPSPRAVPCDDPTLPRRRGTVGVIASLAKVQRIVRRIPARNVPRGPTGQDRDHPASPREPDIPYDTHIASTRDDSQREDRELTTDIRVYTDGSGLDGQAGAAAVLARFDGLHDIRRTLRYHLGPLSEHTVYEAEALGVILGAHLLATEVERAAKTVSISLDNQPVIRASEQPHRAQPGHYLLDEFRQMMAGLVTAHDARRGLDYYRFPAMTTQS